MQILINGWFVGQDATGHGQYTHHLLAHFPRHADDITFTLALPRSSDGMDEAWQAQVGQVPHWQAQWPAVRVLHQPLPKLPENLTKLWWEQATMPWLARQLRADVLWYPYWAAPLHQPCPVVVTVHDLIPTLLPAYRGGFLQRCYTRLVSYTTRQAQAVLTVSHASARDLMQALDIPAERIHVAYHGPNQEGELQLDRAHLEAVRQRYRLPDRYFLYLGGFDVRKNVSATLHAYRTYLDRGGDPAVALVIAGRLPAMDTAFTPDPQKIAAELKLNSQVHFCGWVDEMHKPAMYALATAFLFPSLYEGFGMMVLEAMQAGAPVVTSGNFQ